MARRKNEEPFPKPHWTTEKPTPDAQPVGFRFTSDGENATY
jgi:hypothetical protein